MKTVHIRSFSGPYFSAFGDTPYLFVFSPNAGKYGLEKLIQKQMIQTSAFIIFIEVDVDYFFETTSKK